MLGIRVLLSASIISIVSFSAIAGAQTKLDPYLGKAVSIGKIKASMTRSIGAEAEERSNETSDVFIRSSDVEATKALIRENGGQVHTTAGDIITASMSMGVIELVASSEEVDFVEAGKPIQMKNDVAALDINSMEVHDGYNLPNGLTGKGVIIGVIDTGIDYTHPDFQDADGKSRILAIWNQTRTSGPAPKIIEDSYGTECDSASIAGGDCPLNDIDGHGTHVAGTAAGSDETYGGIAPDANIIVVSYDSSVSLDGGLADTIFSTKICQAAYYIFSKAEEMGMPAVVNLSLGTHIGPHDGTSLFEQCLAGLIKGSAGRAIVAAAGNEFSTETGFTGIHTGFEVSGKMASNFAIRQLTRDRLYYIDLWGAVQSDFSVGLAVRNGSANGRAMAVSEMVDAGATTEGTFLGGNVQYTINFTETRSALNGKPHCGILLKVSSSATDISNYTFDLVVSGTGSFDAWLFPDKPSKTIQFTKAEGPTGDGWTLVKGNSEKTVAIPATSPDIIAVAAYTTRSKWDMGGGCCQVNFADDNIVPFSSSGPSAAPAATGSKPDIAAPGAMIASTMSFQSKQDASLIMKDGMHVLQAGTSMASPFVTGAIALMFSADPNFTYEDVKKYIVESAYVDNFVGEVPNVRWGNGKLDVLAAVETAIKGGSSGRFDRNANLNETTPPAANEESQSSKTSGCSIVTSQGSASQALSIVSMMAAVASAIIAARRRAA